MANAAKRVDATPRRDQWHDIEGRVFGQCMWQHLSKNRRVILEGLMHKRAGRIMIVEKSYSGPIPRGGERPFPELDGVVVYDQVAPEVSHWDEFERALERVP